MDNSILYGLRNPAMTDDIGMSMIERQFPTTMNSMTYVPADGSLPQINNGQPQSDIYQNKRKKEYSLIKKILLGIGAVALGIIGIKTGPKIYNKIASKVPNLISKCKTGIINLFNKIKTKISP